jgi:hypothetical protein
MALVKRFTLATMILVLTVPIALAGPNDGGVLVVHATTLEYTADTPSYIGLSGIACGQDGPPFPGPQECENTGYDPIGGADPCDQFAANATSTVAALVPHVWYVLAAFPLDSCPRLKGLAFRIKYDATKVLIVANGVSDPAWSILFPLVSTEDSSPFPSDRSGISLGFTDSRTSRLQEVWWFAGYSYGEATDATFALMAESSLGGGQNVYFVDDSIPQQLDLIADFGVLGLGGATGHNPRPEVTPVEKTSWSRIKATYGPR